MMMKPLILAIFIALTPILTNANECEKMPYRIQGISMEPVLSNGITIHITPLTCYGHPIAKNDIILVRSGADKNPLIKTVRAIAGDDLKVKQSGDVWHIDVNGEILKNSQNTVYSYSKERAAMLKLYQGILLPETMLILGEGTTGTTDSSRFGLVHKKDVIGILSK